MRRPSSKQASIDGSRSLAVLNVTSWAEANADRTSVITFSRAQGLVRGKYVTSESSATGVSQPATIRVSEGNGLLHPTDHHTVYNQCIEPISLAMPVKGSDVWSEVPREVPGGLASSRCNYICKRWKVEKQQYFPLLCQPVK